MGKITHYGSGVPDQGRTSDSVRQEAEQSFWLIVTSSINQTSDFYRSLFQRLDPDTYRETLNGITTQGTQIVEFMVHYYDEYDTMPSEAAFNDRFRMKLKSRTGYSQHELSAHCDKVVTCLKRITYVQNLGSIMKHVMVDGVTASDVQEVFKMSVEDSIDKEEFDPIMELKRRKEAGGYRLFVESLDRLCRGIKKGSVATIAAYAGGFKTCWAINIALRNALAKVHVVYLSFEVDRTQLYARLYSALSRCPESPVGRSNAIPFEAILHQVMSEKQKHDLETTVVPFYRQNIEPYLTILDEEDIAPTDMDEDELSQLLYRIDDRRPIDVLVVDHIGMTKFYHAHGKARSNARDEFSQINNYVSYFRRLSLNFRKDESGISRKIGVLLLCQINRQGYERALKDSQNKSTSDDAALHHGRYTLTSLAEANEVEKSSSYVFTIFAIKESNTAYVQLLKNRNGPTLEEGTCTPIEPEYNRFGDMDIVPEDVLYSDLGKANVVQVNNFGDGIEEAIDSGDLLSYAITDNGFNHV